MSTTSATLTADVPTKPVTASSTRSRIAALSLGVFVFTFLVYWLLGPMNTPYDFQLSQANNIIHGHLDMTEQYTRNLNLLERVLYDGKGFCLPTNDPRGPEIDALIPNARYSDTCLHYMQHSLGPALLLIPLVLVFGMTVSQTLISCLVGAAAAAVVFAITRHFTSQLRMQLALTVLAMFGTQIWYSATEGSVWHFAHATAFFFMVSGIYFTVVRRNPLLAGAMFGAAFMCRPSTILGGLFAIIAFSDMWLPAATETGRSILRRVNLRPLIALALGVAPFIILNSLINYMRFGSPFESGYSYGEQVYQDNLTWVYKYGLFNPLYIARHVAIVFEQMPVFSSQGSYIYPSWAGQAIWATSPAILLGLFAHLRKWVWPARLAALAVALSGALLIIGAAADRLGIIAWTPADVPFGLHLLPFWVLIALAIGLSLAYRDRLVVACWAAIVPIALFNWMFAATGWAQFGYRYGLDFMPFLILLAVIMVSRGTRLTRYQVVLIGVSVLINLWGVLWIDKLAQIHPPLFGWTFVGW
ncbi:MAG: hypothetical protein QFC55_01230 [Chloroflexota bacterium]|nr:hypothetical protein [Chloroflexota bacterium]